MGLEEIIANIESDTKAKVASVLDSAAKEGQRIKEDAQKKANEHIDMTKKKAQGDAARLVARELSRANIESRRIYQDALTQAVDSAWDMLGKSLSEYTKSTDYSALLNKLVSIAENDLGSDCTVWVQKADIPKIKKSRSTVMEAKEEFSGGLRASTKDGKMSVDFTLENILQGIKEDIAVKVLDAVKKEKG